jgi:superfamily II DNA or RNA helicase
MISRNEIQKEATNKIIENNFRGIVIAAMRSGKTKMIIDALKSFKGSVLWVTDKQKLRDIDIPNEIKQWGDGYKFDIKIICYNSIPKSNPEKYDLVILDECQRLTHKGLHHLLKNKRILACTGTFPNNYEKKELFKTLRLNIIYELSVDDAVDSGVIAPYEITIMYHKLDSISKNVEVKYKDSMGVDKSFYTTESERYKYITRRIGLLIDSGQPTKFHAINRMRFIGNCRSKERLALKILAENENKKILIFCSNIKQAEKITPLSYHSKTDDACLKAFMDDKINHLSVVDMVDTGVTFPKIDIILILTSNSSNVKTVQRIGRSLMYIENFIAQIVILCASDTVEKSWLEKALADLNNKNINIVEVE